MKQSKSILFDKKQTGRKMKYLIEKYHKDLEKMYTNKNGSYMPLSQLTLREFFKMVRDIPYRKDSKPVEVISRPFHIMRHKILGMDCKKKCIVMCSYLRCHRLPYRLMSSSRKKSGEIHHVFPQVKLKNQWLNLDATYPHNKIFDKKLVTNSEVIA